MGRLQVLMDQAAPVELADSVAEGSAGVLPQDFQRVASQTVPNKTDAFINPVSL
jgi:hypothetical protein